LVEVTARESSGCDMVSIDASSVRLMISHRQTWSQHWTLNPASGIDIILDSSASTSTTLVPSQRWDPGGSLTCIPYT